MKGKRHTAETFWALVDRRGDTECWEWLASKHPYGYGQVGFQGRHTSAHRVAYVLTNGNIPDGLHVCHACDNPGCVNPAHLWLGTNDDNIADKMSKRRHRGARGEAHGRAKLTQTKADAIRKDTRPLRTIGADYGVSESTVRQVKRRQTWNY